MEYLAAMPVSGFAFKEVHLAGYKASQVGSFAFRYPRRAGAYPVFASLYQEALEPGACWPTRSEWDPNIPLLL